jgi:hypothetical protein
VWLDGEDPGANPKLELNWQRRAASLLEISGVGFGKDSETKSDTKLDTGGLLAKAYISTAETPPR